jgi:hypothetical protein
VEALDTIFSIPTYRLRDVPETIERYDENFWRNGHEVALFVFDDSSLANHDKYYSQLGKTRTANPLYYVGPREKERFIQILCSVCVSQSWRRLSAICFVQAMAGTGTLR